jgi:hypothetical protein
MDLSIPAYFFLGPGFSLLVLEFLFPPFQANFGNGIVLGLGRSPVLLPPSVAAAVSVTINWSALGADCLALAICVIVSYRMLSRAEPLWAKE